MKKLLISTIAIAAISVVMIQPSHSQPECYDHDSLVKSLGTGEFTEVIKIRGLVKKGKQMMEIFVNQNTGSFSVIIVHPNGAACPVASGEAFTIINDVKPAADGPNL